MMACVHAYRRLCGRLCASRVPCAVCSHTCARTQPRMVMAAMQKKKIKKKKVWSWQPSCMCAHCMIIMKTPTTHPHVCCGLGDLLFSDNHMHAPKFRVVNCSTHICACAGRLVGIAVNPKLTTPPSPCMRWALLDCYPSTWRKHTYLPNKLTCTCWASLNHCPSTWRKLT